MDDVVAVEVLTDAGERCYFVTWGRIQDAVDPTALEAIVLEHASRCATPGAPVYAAVCWSLRDASHAPYFYEAIIDFGRRPVPRNHDRWRRRIDAQMRRGKHLNFVGPNQQDVERLRARRVD